MRESIMCNSKVLISKITNIDFRYAATYVQVSIPLSFKEKRNALWRSYQHWLIQYWKEWKGLLGKVFQEKTCRHFYSHFALLIIRIILVRFYRRHTWCTCHFASHVTRNILKKWGLLKKRKKRIRAISVERDRRAYFANEKTAFEFKITFYCILVWTSIYHIHIQ